MEQVIEYRNMEYVLKFIFISAYTIYLNYKILNIKNKNNINCIKIIFGIMFSVGISTILKYYFNVALSMIALDIFIAFIFSNLNNINMSFSLIITTISLTINYILYSLAIIFNYFMFKILNIANEYIILIGIIVTYSIIFYLICKIKRLQKGITFFKKNQNNQYFIILILNASCIIFLTIMILLNMNLTIERTILFCYIFILSIIMFITIQKSLQLYYKQKLQEREVEEIKEELKNKDKEIEELEKENLKLNKKNHSIAHKQKSLEYELEQMGLNNQIMDKNHVKDKIESLSKEMQNETVSIELTKTNIDKIDSMLKYMQSECVKNKIDFQLQVNGNIHHMINKHIEKEDLEILIADLIKNAIIAINHSENINKSILVRLGLIDGAYSLYVYDSGIEFEIDTLINLGIKPSTTHAKDGGTGMGLMNTFDTLKKYKASLIIDEYGKPVKDNFTKVIKIIFDSKSQYKIVSYRKKSIQEKDMNKRISYEL